jgi:membrane-associated phospholipid phosphatase
MRGVGRIGLRGGGAPGWALAATLFAALLILGAAVRQGRLEAVDHFASVHLQPLRTGDWSLLTTPAGPVAAPLLVLAGVVAMRRPATTRMAWMLVFAASIPIELAGKRLVVRAHVDADRLPWLAHDGFPSGHTMRGVIVAGALATAFPRARLPLIAWAFANAALVETTGMHPLSEVVGGLLGGAALVACVRAAGQRRVAAAGVAGSRVRACTRPRRLRRTPSRPPPC